MELEIFQKKILVDHITLNNLIQRSPLTTKYATTLNPDSSFEDYARTRWCINSTKKGWTILRTEYLLNRTEHGYGKGDILAMNSDGVLYAIEFKSLRDRYFVEDFAKINKLKKAEYILCRGCKKNVWNGMCSYGHIGKRRRDYEY